jgi:hypothetical protein
MQLTDLHSFLLANVHLIMINISSRHAMILINNVTRCLKPGIVEPEEISNGRQQFSKHVPAATVTCATTEELLEVVFAMQSVPRLYI